MCPFGGQSPNSANEKSERILPHDAWFLQGAALERPIVSGEESTALLCEGGSYAFDIMIEDASYDQTSCSQSMPGNFRNFASLQLIKRNEICTLA